MSRDASITLDWADGTYRFRLAWGQLIELQEKCDAGPWYILGQLANPLAAPGARVQFVSEVIRLGLIGGGMKPLDALTLVRRYAEARPPDESLETAYQVLEAALSGAPDEQPGKSAALELEEPNPSRAENSGSPGSSAQEP